MTRYNHPDDQSDAGALLGALRRIYKERGEDYDAIERARRQNMKQHLTCCCCGDGAGQWQQWHNRDSGYGMCAKCIAWLRRENRASEEEIKNLYGVEGVNWG